jgi:hypothetical protein
MTIKRPTNPNYCATVVALQQFRELPNCDNVKAAIIFGNSVIVGKDHQPGDVGLFFPVETQISAAFLGANNLFRKAEFGNADPTKAGFFEQHGRVKCMKFRGHKSEGLWVPLASLFALIPASPDLMQQLAVGVDFDEIDGIQICTKYVPKKHPRRLLENARDRRRARRAPKDRILDGQFRFHIDTENLRRNIHNLTPDMVISISDKWHGTSAIYSNILVERELKWYERLAKWMGVAVQEHEYGFTWSSRRVIKGVAGTAKAEAVHYYGSDIWGVVAKEIEHCVPKGYTIYGEIVGWTPEGAPIQGGYAYGCAPGTHRFLVYRVTVTNPDGKLVELTWEQMKTFCTLMGLEHVRELWAGPIVDFGKIPEQFPDESAWREALLEEMEMSFVHDQDCPFNPGKPAEGIVVKVDSLDECIAFKLKNFRFLKQESDQNDKGVVDIETEESVAVEEGGEA